MTKRTVHHFISEQESFEQRLVHRLGDCQTATLATAFFTYGAFSQLIEPLAEALTNGARLTFLLGRFDFVTEPRAVRGLLGLGRQHPGQMTVLFDASYDFHYKLALFQLPGKGIVIIGSSNLTPKGLASAGEVNLEIVNSRAVMRQAQDTLRPRLQAALPAEKDLPEYARLYRRAKQYRAARQHWNRRGHKRLTHRRRQPAPVPARAGATYAVCRIDGWETDKKLIRNIQTAKRSLQLSGQWVHVEKSDTRLYKDNDVIIVVDDLGHSFGFARVGAVTRILDSHESREVILFYRYLRGGKASVPARLHEATTQRLGLRTQRNRVREAASKLARYLARR